MGQRLAAEPCVGRPGRLERLVPEAHCCDGLGVIDELLLLGAGVGELVAGDRHLLAGRQRYVLFLLAELRRRDTDRRHHESQVSQVGAVPASLAEQDDGSFQHRPAVLRQHRRGPGRRERHGDQSR